MCQLEYEGILGHCIGSILGFSSVDTFISAHTFSSKISFIWFNFNESDLLLHKIFPAIFDLGVPNSARF